MLILHNQKLYRENGRPFSSREERIQDSKIVFQYGQSSQHTVYHVYFCQKQQMKPDNRDSHYNPGLDYKTNQFQICPKVYDLYCILLPQSFTLLYFKTLIFDSSLNYGMYYISKYYEIIFAILELIRISVVQRCEY